MDQELGVRAALLGLGSWRGRPGGEARPAGKLEAATSGSPLEASRAMGWCGVYDGVDPMLVLLKQTQKKNIQAWTGSLPG